MKNNIGFLLLFTFAMGFGLLFLILGTFSHLANKIPRSGMWMNRVKVILAICLFALSAYYVWPLAKPYLVSAPAEESAGVKWIKFDPQKVIEAKAAGRPVIIDFYADWCVSCVEMDQFTFSDQSVINKSRQFVMLKVDATSPFPELKDWQVKYKVYGLPTMIFIGSDGLIRDDLILTGFEEAPEFIERMNQATKKPSNGTL